MHTPAPPAGPPVIALSGNCKLFLTQEALRFVDEKSGVTLEIPRAQAPDRLERLGLEKGTPRFFLHVPKPRLFTLGPEDAKRLQDWLGPETTAEARHQLRRKVGFNLPIGVFYLATAFSNLWWWVIGAVLVLTGLLFKYRPHVNLFLLDGLFWMLVLIYQGLALVRDPGWFTGGVVVLNAALLVQSIRLFLRFRTTPHPTSPSSTP